MRTCTLQTRSLSAVLMLVFVLCISQHGFAVPSDSCGSLDRLKVALAFAQAVEPELKGNEFSVSFSPGNGTFVNSPIEADVLRMRLDQENLWHPAAEAANQYYARQIEAMRRSGIELPLDIYFSFIANENSIKPSHRQLTCHPAKFTRETGYTQMRKVQTFLDAHPEWSDDEELKAARTMGLRYGPETKAAVLRLLPLKELSRFYGPLKVQHLEFSMNTGGKCPGCSFSDPNWTATILEVGTRRSLLIVIEPFFGKVASIVE